jgi:hypothetical protein
MIGKILIAGAAVFAVRKLVDAGERARDAGGGLDAPLNLRPVAEPGPLNPAPVREVSAEDAWNDARKSVQGAEPPPADPAASAPVPGAGQTAPSTAITNTSIPEREPV